MNGKILRTCKLFQAILLGAILAGCSQTGTAQENSPKGRKQARATIEPKGESRLTGRAIFAGPGNSLTLRVAVEDAPPGLHAVHIHEIGDCSSPDGKSAGGHWNPNRVDHGKWGTDPFHMGDIGNLEVGTDGKGTLSLTTHLWSIGGSDANDVTGRAIVVHSGADDFVSQPTGNAGGRIGCGVIE